MDCNKEEALKAKQIAEKKMENKDFSGALKTAIKAQQLYPQLENVSQMILVCEVHCSADKRVYGNEKDWYSILKIDPSVDDLSIKKQYRKLALVLHPDKNKFSGSADAFKLIGEAQRVLLDPDKRTMHDNKRKAFGNTNTLQRQPNVRQHPWNQTNFTQGHSGNFHFQQQRAPTGVSGIRPTFWTVCPFCSVRYQFYRDDVLNKDIHCQSCKKSFTAYELNVQAAGARAPATNQSQSQTHQPPLFPFRGAEGANRNFTTTPVFGRDNIRPKEPPKAQGNANRKRKKKVQESSESSESENSSESEEEEEEEVEAEEGSESSENENSKKFPPSQDFHYFGEQPRRSSRPKRNVSYKENPNDNDEDGTPSNKAKKKEPRVEVEDTFWKADVKTEENKESVQQPDSEPEHNEHKKPEEPEVYECPDPEFSDFDKQRREDSFGAGQIWAVYDDEDAMPRFYAYIKKVVSPGFKLLITWLEPVAQNDDETKWVEADMPVGCGKFKRGKHDKAEDVPMFSHLVSWEAQKTTFTIFPRKGETWAIFRNWSMNWSVCGARKYEYEFVEIVSDFDENEGARVCVLEKVKEFRCVFRRKEEGEMVIGGRDKLRFSHMVPCCRMSGEEREGVPEGSYELDPAGLPASTFEQVPPISISISISG